MAMIHWRALSVVLALQGLIACGVCPPGQVWIPGHEDLGALELAEERCESDRFACDFLSMPPLPPEWCVSEFNRCMNDARDGYTGFCHDNSQQMKEKVEEVAGSIIHAEPSQIQKVLASSVPDLKLSSAEISSLQRRIALTATRGALTHSKILTAVNTWFLSLSGGRQLELLKNYALVEKAATKQTLNELYRELLKLGRK